MLVALGNAACQHIHLFKTPEGENHRSDRNENQSPRRLGRVMYQNFAHAPAPSNSPASYRF